MPVAMKKKNHNRAAAEAGNSEAVTRSNYQDAKTPEESEEWFRVTHFCHAAIPIGRGIKR
jgi:hypothetical protein